MEKKRKKKGPSKESSKKQKKKKTKDSNYSDINEIDLIIKEYDEKKENDKETTKKRKRKTKKEVEIKSKSLSTQSKLCIENIKRNKEDETKLFFSKNIEPIEIDLNRTSISRDINELLDFNSKEDLELDAYLISQNEPRVNNGTEIDKEIIDELSFYIDQDTGSITENDIVNFNEKNLPNNHISEEDSLKLLEIEEKKKKFSSLHNKDPFHLEDPSDYAIFKLIGEEEKTREKEYRERIRKEFFQGNPIYISKNIEDINGTTKRQENNEIEENDEYIFKNLMEETNSIKEKIKNFKKRNNHTSTNEDYDDEEENEIFHYNIDDSDIKTFNEGTKEEYYLFKGKKIFSPEECNKNYCMEFLREAVPEMSERNCKYEDKCTTKIFSTKYLQTSELILNDSDNGFICREFLTPSEDKLFKTEGKLPKNRKQCLICNRIRTTDRYLWFQKTNKPVYELMQDHWNTFNEPGEYNLEKCIFFTGSKKKISKLFRPIIKYSSNNYIYNNIIV